MAYKGNGGHSSEHTKYVCTECSRIVDDHGVPGKVSQDRGGKRVQSLVCRWCFDAKYLGQKAGAA